MPGSEGDFCASADGTTFGHCATDASGCLFVAAEDNACATGQTCQVAGVVPTGSACGCPADGPAIGRGCAAAGPGATLADTAENAVLSCQVTGACMLWTVAVDCASQQLTAGTVAGADVCVCPAAPVDTLYVDPAPAPATLLNGPPTGAPQPAACRLPSITAALAKITTGSGIGRILVQHEDFATAPSIHLSAETFPLAIPSGVNLLAGEIASPRPDRYIIDIGAVASAGAAVLVGDAASITGFTLDAGGAAGAGDAGTNVTAVLACAGSASQFATADHVAIVSHTGATAVAVGGCSMVLSDSSITGGSVGVAISAGSANVSGLTLDLSDPAAAGPLVGVAASGGMASFADATLHGSARFTGLQLSGAAAVTFTGSAAGAAQITTSLPPTSSDDASGVTLAAGASAASLVFHGPVQVSGFANGVVIGDGAFLSDGAAVVSGNRGDGVQILDQTVGPAVTLTGMTIRDNGAKGLVVRTVVPVTFSAGAITGNGSDGLDAQRTQPATLVMAAQLTVATSTISSNMGRGVALTGQGEGTGAKAGGKVGAQLMGDAVTANGGVGVYVTEAPDAVDGPDTTEVWLSGNDIGGNLTAATASGLAGGLYFATSDASTLIQLRAFSSNRVHGNGRAEIGFDLPQADGSPWNLSATAAQHSDLCTDAAGPSFVYCYNNFPGDYAIATASASVHVAVQGMHFQNAPAIAGVDFSPTIPTTEINSFCTPQACQ